MSVGIDCGARKIAVVCPERDYYLAFEIKPIDYPRFYRLGREVLDSLAKTFHDEQWYMEGAIVAGVKNLQSTIKVAQTTGLVRTMMPNVVEVAVSSWKKATVGKGNAKKEDVRLWLDTNHPDMAARCGGNQDLYDAACIAIYGGLTDRAA